MTIVFFDLDNTLIAGDSDYEWGQWVSAKGIVEPNYQIENQRFFVQYQQGVLNIHEYLEFVIRALKTISMAKLELYIADYIAEKVVPMQQTKAHALLQYHRVLGHTPVIVTSTLQLIAEPVGRLLGFEYVLATQAEVTEQGLSGSIVGQPCYQSGKIAHVHQWLAQYGANLSGSYFYSDSHNDIALLEKVCHPVVVDPDELLLQKANKEGWAVISLRD